MFLINTHSYLISGVLNFSISSGQYFAKVLILIRALDFAKARGERFLPSFVNYRKPAYRVILLTVLNTFCKNWRKKVSDSDKGGQACGRNETFSFYRCHFRVE